MVGAAITSAVSGLNSTGAAMNKVADDIANSSTTAYKGGATSFAGLITGGVTATERSFVSQQGTIESTGRETDLAISGQGFFAVQNDAGETFFTRAASFTINNRGELVNEAGYTLLSWRLNNDGLRPGDPSNADDTTPSESTDSLSIVDINTISGTASATSTINVGMNLDAGQPVLQGATAVLDLQNSVNSSKGRDGIIEATAGMQFGDEITFTANTVESTYTYSGFAQSYDVSNGIFGVTSSTANFLTGTQANGSILADGDQFAITPTSGSAITFTYSQSNPSTANGEFNSLATLQQAIDSTAELNATLSSSGRVLVSSIDADDGLTFAEIGGSNLASEFGFSNVSDGSNRFNTLGGLADKINGTDNSISAAVNNATAASTVEIFSDDPFQDLIVTKNSDSATISLFTPENVDKTETGIIVPTLGTGADSMIPETSTIALTDIGGTTNTFTYGGIGFSNAINASSTIFGATSPTDTMTTGIGATDTITVSDSGGGNVVLTFGTGVGEFDTLQEMADLINADGDFSAEIQNNRIYVTTVDGTSASESISFVTADNSASGLTDTTFAAAFGGSFTAGGQIVALGSATRFNTLEQLDAMVNASANAVTSTLTTGTGASISLVDGTTAGNDQLTVGGTSNDQLLEALGLTSGAVGDSFFAELGLASSIVQTSGITVGATDTFASISQSYDPASPLFNMASGSVDPQFSRNIQIFDSLGAEHDFRLAYVKTSVNEWAVEFYAINESEVVTTNDDGLVASGTLSFNGDGSLLSISGSIAAEFDVQWSEDVGASINSISFGLGTPGDIGEGLTDGIRQFDSTFNVEFAEQNGVSAGQFTSITIDENGFISANFSNGEIKEIYQIPIVLVANPNELDEVSGGVYSATQASGDPNLKIVGNGGAGVIVPEALEGSTTDLAEELTLMIPIQTAYNASAKVITTADEMLEALNRI